MTSFEVYAKWNLETRGHPVPFTREQFDAAMKHVVVFVKDEPTNEDIQFDKDNDRREGW